MSTASKKRKLNSDVSKYYAVRAGKTPGVYRTWADCQANTTGFKGASYKSFTSEQEAKDFVAGKPIGSKSASGQPNRFYGIAVGHKPGVYENWDEAQAQVTDIKGPIYKKFETREEAEEFVRTKGQSSIVDRTKASTKAKQANGKAANKPVAKKAKVTSESSSKSKSKGSTLRVYTDGSSRGNGRVGAIAGVGVYFGEGDDRNVSEPLEGTRQTNQRAELTGILRALEIAPRDRNMEIITDSSYSINCCTVWITSWLQNNWKTSLGKDVENKDLVVSIKHLLDEREASGVDTIFTWVKGHDSDPGNEAADRLAVAGAMAERYE